MVYITHQRARAFGSLAYNKAKQGYNMLVTYGNRQWWLSYTINSGFYLQPYAVAA